jgi:hypothetical protein
MVQIVVHVSTYLNGPDVHLLLMQILYRDNENVSFLDIIKCITSLIQILYHISKDIWTWKGGRRIMEKTA